MTKRYILKPTDNPKININFEAELNSSQLDVVKNADGPSLVLAGAGSGKTRTLIYRVLYLIQSGVQPDQILLVTFTNKAAAEMRHRAESYLGSQLDGLWCGTFHHIALRILRQHASKIGLSDRFGVIDEEDSKTLLKSCYSILPFKPSDVRFPQVSIVKKIISYSQNSCISIDDTVDKLFPYFAHFSDNIKDLYNEYTRKKALANSLDFDDLILKWLDILENHPDLKDRLRNQFKYCLVDEYQDINPLQNRAIEALSSSHNNLIVVGDDAQSIYSFRGAEIQSILKFPDRHKDTKIFKLQTNYRSSPEIVELTNASIQNNMHQFQKELTSAQSPMGLPQVVKVRDSKDQAMFVSQRLLELVDDGISPDKIAVLFRARYQAAELEMELSKRQIPYVLRGGVRFFEQAHIKDAVSFLKIIDNPSDEISWMRAFSLYPGIGPGTAAKVHANLSKSLQVGSSLKDFLNNSTNSIGITKRSLNGWNSFKGALNKIIAIDVAAGPNILLQQILDAGYAKSLESRFDNASDRYDDLTELVAFAGTYDSNSAFLSDLALRENFRGETVVQTDSGMIDQKQLILSTIHQAKGLEWDAVFVLSLSEGHFPHHQAKASDVAMEEERRLFYVATTRAKNSLYLIHPMTRFDREAGTILSHISPFLNELPSHTYEAAEAIQEDDAQWDAFEETILVDD